MTTTGTDHRVAVRVDGFSGRVHVRDEGQPDGSALVLLHGFSGSMRWFDRVVPDLTPSFRVVRVDLAGHGGTGGPAIDAPAQARMVTAVLAELGITAATVVGHSFGADVAVALAETDDRIDRLVIVCQAPDYSDANLPRGNRVMTLPLLGAGLHRAAVGAGTALAAVVRRTGRGPVDPALARQALHDLRALNSGMFRVVLLDRRTRLARRPLDAQVRDAAKPTLAILGGRDHFYGDRSRARYEAAGAQVVVLAESGHSPLIEFPDETATLITDFARCAERDGLSQ